MFGAVAVGSHGESVRNLLRPGFHSGVVPKTFAKLRYAETHGRRARVAKLHHQLEHIEESVNHLALRELAAYLKSSRRWGGLPVHVDRIRLATNRLRIPLSIHHWDSAVVISIEQRGGYLIGSIEEAGWLDRLSEKQRAAFRDALTALYKLAGVHVLREQASSVLRIEPSRLDCRPEGLLVLSNGAGEPVSIDCGDEPQLLAGGPIDGRTLPPIAAADLLLSERSFVWNQWVERWEQDHAGKSPLGACWRGIESVNLQFATGLGKE